MKNQIYLQMWGKSSFVRRFFFSCCLFFISLVVSAVTITTGTTLYLRPGVWSDSGTARYAAYFYTGTATGTFVNMSESSTLPIEYKVVAPSGSFSNVIFCRMNGATSANTWTNVWNQTEDLTYNGVDQRYTISGWGTTTTPSTGAWSSAIEDTDLLSDHYTVLPVCSNTGGLEFDPDLTSPITAITGPAYFCLNSSGVLRDFQDIMYYPTFYYIKISRAGTLMFDISMDDDVDYIVWGPYDSPDVKFSDLTIDKVDIRPLGTNPGSDSNYKCYSCSFSRAEAEKVVLENAEVGKYYILGISNFAKASTPISITTDATSTAESDCSIISDCDMQEITNTLSDIIAGKYTAQGTVSFNNAPTTGTLHIKDNVSDIQQVFNAPFSSPRPFALTGIPVDGKEHIITASFSDATCTLDYSYSSPLPVDPCVIPTINFSFEAPVMTGGLEMVPDSNVPGWNTTASDGIMEFWRSGQLGVSSFEGNTFIELNANMVAGVYQDYDTPNAVIFNFKFAHRGRSGTDVCKVSAGPVGGPYTEIMTASDGNTAWGEHEGSYIVPAGQVKTRFIFESLTSTGGDPTVGNFLDAINFIAEPIPPTVIHDTLTYCVGDTPASLSTMVTGSSLKWYNAATGGTGSATVPTVSTATSGFTSFYVSQTPFSTCESARVELVINVKNCTTDMLLAVNGSINTVCNGGSNPGQAACTGKATVTATQGTEPYTYLWDDALAQTDATATGLCAGTYTVTVTDATNQTKTIEYTVENEVKTSTISDEIYQGQSYTANGFDLPIQTETGVFTHELTTQTALGCDSIVTLTLTVLERGAISLSIDGTVNTVCNGTQSAQNCEYDGPSIMINEFVVAPIFNDGQFYNTSGTLGGEWVELYNPHPCDSIDVSGYLIGNYTSEGSGAYLIPSGTVVPPLGFFVLRGALADVVPAANLIKNGGDVVEVSFTAPPNPDVCVGTTGRFWLPNDGGWLAMYDRDLVAQDALAWKDYTPYQNDSPCNPSPIGSIPPSFADIPNNRKSVTTLSVVPSSGKPFRRDPDGGAWSTVEASATQATIGACNGTCTPPVIGTGSSTCTGTATVVVEEGVAPYTYLWDDVQAQTTATAIGLCAGTYTVTVTDATGQEETISYTVEDYVPEVSHEDIDVCATALPLDLTTQPNVATPAGGVYSGDGIANSILSSYTATSINASYTYAVDGCENTALFTITIHEVVDSTFSDTICVGQMYDKYGFTLPVQHVAGEFPFQSDITNSYGCSYTKTLSLTVGAPSFFDDTQTICQGEVYAFRGRTLRESGVYADTLVSSLGCDSIYQLNLTVYPTYDRNVEATICQGDEYLFNGQPLTLPGIYVDTLQTQLGCDSIATLQLKVIDFGETMISPPKEICYGASVDLYVMKYPLGSTFLWTGYGLQDPMRANQTVLPLQSEPYSVRVQNQGCSTILETSITVNENPIITGFTEDAETAGIVQLAYHNGTPPYEFVLRGKNKYSNVGYFDNLSIGNYIADLVDSKSCTATFVFYLDIPVIPDKFFSPNNDGVNDTWKIKNIELVSHTVYIYDRFSKLLATYEENFDAWDGTYLGDPLPTTDYWYLIKVRPINRTLTGHFTLKR